MFEASSERPPYTLLRMSCTTEPTFGREFDLIVDLLAGSSVGRRGSPICTSVHLKHGRLVRPGQPAPPKPPTPQDKLKKFSFAPDYPGCPYCRQRYAFICDCGTINCASEKGFMKTCAGCRKRSMSFPVDWVPGGARGDG